ncbi:hypothetical protein GvMRE_I1g42 [endosymbiont GvMRE of Glomus versiforme]|nr:hypothetical protein GvMRE_I1g42 [endosymbiont GvMRE of Glomus versiforme]
MKTSLNNSFDLEVVALSLKYIIMKNLCFVCIFKSTPIVQRKEYLTSDQRVGGSNPPRRTKFKIKLIYNEQ